MATKVIYFTVGGYPEQAEFRADDPTDDVKGELCMPTCQNCFVAVFISFLCLTRV